ncbi:phosphopyruvate hydratase [Candidatus Peregrinibacteria bacterium]|nr:phosphopyruvate hydratase [Candidatus Peregrinibacteria bacterium]
MSRITHIHTLEVLDSRGNPTVEVEVQLESGANARAIVPSGASTGAHEAVELRDGDKNRYLGKGVLKAVQNVNTEIAKAVIGMESEEQKKIDQTMIDLDGTMNKERLGANAILGVSLATAKATALEKSIPLFEYFGHLAGNSSPNLLPTPMMNVVNGGAHADSGMEIQEFMIFSTGAENFSEALRMGSETFHHLKKILAARKMVTAVGDEGGFAPHFKTNEEAIEVILEAIHEAGHDGKIQIALDAAASEFYEEGKGYKIRGEYKTAEEMLVFYSSLVEKYPIISIEDPFFEDDWDAFTALTKAIGDKIQIVGDDLLVTNPRRVQMAIVRKCVNSALIKVNQIGTLSETIETVGMAKNAKWTSVISHRSGETEDTTIADLAVGLLTGQIKTGSLCRSERIAKYNQLLRIETMLGKKAKFQGKIR